VNGCLDETLLIVARSLAENVERFVLVITSVNNEQVGGEPCAALGPVALRVTSPVAGRAAN
jgi:hypothetical protein